MSTTPESEATRDAVRERYAGIARETMAGDRRGRDGQLLCPELLWCEIPRCDDACDEHRVYRRRTK